MRNKKKGKEERREGGEKEGGKERKRRTGKISSSTRARTEEVESSGLSHMGAHLVAQQRENEARRFQDPARQ